MANGAVQVGLLAMSKLRVNQNPDVEVPGLFVTIAYPGASPDTVEREIVNRIEKSLQSISGVTEMSYNSTPGNGRYGDYLKVRPAPKVLLPAVQEYASICIPCCVRECIWR